ncbi:hypothetical protein KC867_01850, partial [Candidatus Saccharibacteria bacterium]|nr:hypothetical protein [Candidatus Saccharibacteria bacterium]
MRLPKPTHEQRLPLVLLAIILVCTVFASVILPSFSASAQQTYNIEQKAKAYQAGMALGNCADHASDMTNIRTSEQKYVIGDIKLDVLKNFQLKFSSHTTHPGNMMENDDGKVGCDNVKELQALWSAIGVTDLTNFLTTSQNGNAALYSWPSDSDGTWVRPTKDAEASKALLKKIIRDHTQNTYGLSDWGEMSNSNPEQAAIKYATAYMNFDSKCVNWNDNGTNTAKVYDSSSRQMIDKKFFYKSDMENKGVTIGYGMGGRNNQMLNCGEILGILNNSTINGHFASENNRLQDAGVNISSSSSSATEDDSCESTSGPLGWIMCPVAGLLDSATDFLDGQIQSKLI